MFNVTLQFMPAESFTVVGCYGKVKWISLSLVFGSCRIVEWIDLSLSLSLSLEGPLRKSGVHGNMCRGITSIYDVVKANVRACGDLTHSIRCPSALNQEEV